MRRTSTRTAGCDAWKAGDQRQHRVDAGLVGPDQHAPFPDVAQVGDGASGFIGEPQQTGGVVEQQLAGVGQGAVARRAVDQALAGVVFEPPDRLADGRLGAPEFACGAGKTALGGDNGEYAEILEGHKQD
jgi:hypothetical protein